MAHPLVTDPETKAFPCFIFIQSTYVIPNDRSFKQLGFNDLLAKISIIAQLTFFVSSGKKSNVVRLIIITLFECFPPYTVRYSLLGNSQKSRKLRPLKSKQYGYTILKISQIINLTQIHFNCLPRLIFKYLAFNHHRNLANLAVKLVYVFYDIYDISLLSFEDKAARFTSHKNSHFCWEEKRHPLFIWEFLSLDSYERSAHRQNLVSSVRTFRFNFTLIFENRTREEFQQDCSC